MNVLSLAGIVFSLFMLSQSVWQMSTRLVSLALHVAEMTLAVIMVMGPSLVTLSPAALAGASFAGNVDTLLRYLSLGVTITLSIIIVIGILEIARALYKLFTPRKSLAFPVAK